MTRRWTPVMLRTPALITVILILTLGIKHFLNLSIQAGNIFLVGVVIVLVPTVIWSEKKSLKEMLWAKTSNKARNELDGSNEPPIR